MSKRFLSVVVITFPLHGKGRRFDPGRNQLLIFFFLGSEMKKNKLCVSYMYAIISFSKYIGSYGVMVSTLDFESSDPSSNLGRTYTLFVLFSQHVYIKDNN